MSAIEASSKKISQIIGSSTKLHSRQTFWPSTRVLKLHAQESGRGFAVVASEVRALAQRSAEAAKEIKGLISASTTQVAQGVELVGETGHSLSRIVERYRKSIRWSAKSLQAPPNRQTASLKSTQASSRWTSQPNRMLRWPRRRRRHAYAAATDGIARTTRVAVRDPSGGSICDQARGTDLIAQQRRYCSADCAGRSQRKLNGTTGQPSFEPSADASNWEEF